MVTSAENARKVESIFREHLERNFQENLKFDPIRVEPTLDQHGEDTFHVTVVYDGDYNLLDFGKLNAISAAMVDQLEALGIRTTVIESYVDKTEDDMRDELLAPEPWEFEEEIR